MDHIKIQLVDSGFQQMPTKNVESEKQELHNLWEEIKSLNGEKKKSQRKMKILFSKIDLLEKKIEQWEKSSYYYKEKKEELDSTITSIKNSLEEFYKEYDQISRQMLDTRKRQEWLATGPLRSSEVEHILGQEIAEEKWKGNQDSSILQRKIEQYKKKLAFTKQQKEELEKNYISNKNLHITTERYEKIKEAVSKNKLLGNITKTFPLSKQEKTKNSIEFLFPLPANYGVYKHPRILLAPISRVNRLIEKGDASVLKIVGPTRFHNYTPEIRPEDMVEIPKEISEKEWDHILESLISRDSTEKVTKTYS